MNTTLKLRTGAWRLALCATAALSLASTAIAAPPSPPPVVGEWVAQKSSFRALEGTLSIRADGSATLAPAGYPKLNGTWALTKDGMTFTMPPHGTTLVHYKRDGARLALTYDNGSSQDFVLHTSPLEKK